MRYLYYEENDIKMKMIKTLKKILYIKPWGLYEK